MARSTGKKKTGRKKERRTVHEGIAFIQATFNNTLISISDMNGNTLCWSSSGSLGFKGSRKGTPFAAQQASSRVAHAARDQGMRTIHVRVKGPGSGRESAVRALASAGLSVRTITNVTKIPHNGCRPPKRRRV